MEVLGQICQGKSNQEIAQALFCAEKTVKTHITSIYKKLNVRDRAQAISLALRKGLVRE